MKTTIATSKGTARLTKCTSAGDAEKQALAQSYRLSAAAGGNEYGSNTYQDAYGNYYIVDPYTQNSHDQIDFGGTDSQINGLTLVGLVHDHFGYEDRSTNPPTFTDYDVSNWSANSPDDTTHTHFSVGDENVSEYYGVPILVILGNVNESFTWTPPAKDANGAFDLTAPDQSLGKVDQNFTC
ncbi:MAG: hypothetical protein GIW97_06265 [Candidatus Eremiobacteraeota bacterium]|nr:hypothetical protein [Candidatus Eremiobacteraeota bacterium]